MGEGGGAVWAILFGVSGLAAAMAAVGVAWLMERREDQSQRPVQWMILAVPEEDKASTDQPN